MMTSETASRFDPFGNDNAKYLNPRDVARTFVPISAFWQLFSDGNHVLLGTRGSGKTAIARMVSHEHLKLLEHPKAREYVEDKRFIGVYAPARLNWVSGVKSQLLGQSGPEREYFVFRINFMLAQSLLSTLSSCVESYVGASDRASLEYSVVKEILALWAPDVQPRRPIFTLKDLSKSVAGADFRLQRAATRNHYGLSGGKLSDFDEQLTLSFGTELAQPIVILWTTISEAFKFTSATKIVVAIDEMEFLSQEQHKILNGLLRAYETGFLFKFVTAPYCHYTLETETNAPLIEDQDFAYVHMDNNREIAPEDINYSVPVSDSKFAFHIAIFLKRAEAAGIPATPELLRKLLGPSEVLDPTDLNDGNLQKTVREMTRHVNWETQERFQKHLTRYERLRDPKQRNKLRTKISNELVRKLKPGVKIRNLVRKQVGAQKRTTYSGFQMVLSCTDGNPRILIRTYNSLFPKLRELTKNPEKISPISAVRQNEVMETTSIRFWDSIWAVPEIGPDLSALIEQLGDAFHQRLHAQPIGTDIPASVAIDETDTEKMRLIRQGVAWGFMYPHFKDERRPALPATRGVFRLSYTLSPKFRILPRKGRSLRLSTVVPQRSLAI